MKRNKDCLLDLETTEFHKDNQLPSDYDFSNTIYS